MSSPCKKTQHYLNNPKLNKLTISLFPVHNQYLFKNSKIKKWIAVVIHKKTAPTTKNLTKQQSIYFQCITNTLIQKQQNKKYRLAVVIYKNSTNTNHKNSKKQSSNRPV